jgi:hypothetical protein
METRHMKETLEIIRELFEELSASNAKSEGNYDELSPMANYYAGKKEAYKLAAERVQMAIDLHKVANATTFEGDI